MADIEKHHEPIEEPENIITEQPLPNIEPQLDGIGTQLKTSDKQAEEEPEAGVERSTDLSNQTESQDDEMQIDPEISGMLDRLEADQRADEATETSETKEQTTQEVEKEIEATQVKEFPESESSDPKTQESQPSPKPLSLESEISEITNAATTTIDADGHTIVRDGVPIPKDSALFQSIDISYNPSQNIDISPSLLIKANLASLPLTLQAHESLPFRIQFLIHSIPFLDNVATQILRMIGVGPYEETLAILTSEEPTPETSIYKDLVELFEQVKRIYSEEDPFLYFHNLIHDVDSLDESVKKTLKELEDSIDSALRKTNLATFLLAALGSIEVGFFYLNESFLDVFCPTHNNGWFKSNNQLPNTFSVTAGKLLKAQAGLFLELKTQAYISALESGDRSKEEVLVDIFPDDLKDQLLQRRGTDDLSPAEQDFLQRCKSRRETLLATSEEQDLSEHYEWLIFLKELFNYVSKNIGFLIWGRKGRHTLLTTIGAPGFDSITLSSSSTPSNNQYALLSKDELQKRLKKQKEKERELKERDEKEAKEIAQGKSSVSTPRQNSTGSSVQQRPRKPVTTNPPRLRQILRRPWSAEEENSLVDALKEFGPSWSKILEKYGAGGSQSEALKDRTQVQLKDKARNWKMGFLKNEGDVPEYLSKVTGDLNDDRSQKKRRRDAAGTNGLPNKRPRSKSSNKNAKKKRKSTPQPTESVSQESRERITQQESSVRTEKEQSEATQDQEKSQEQTSSEKEAESAKDEQQPEKAVSSEQSTEPSAEEPAPQQ